jgi:hypothetical protein
LHRPCPFAIGQIQFSVAALVFIQLGLVTLFPYGAYPAAWNDSSLVVSFRQCGLELQEIGGGGRLLQRVRAILLGLLLLWCFLQTMA